MSITALTGLVPEWYTPISQKDEDDPARFKLTPLDTKQMVEIQSYHITDGKGNGRISPEGLYRAFEISILEWENVNDRTGKPLKCTRNNIKTIPVDLIAELGAEAVSVSFLTDDDAKNS